MPSSAGKKKRAGVGGGSIRDEHADVGRDMMTPVPESGKSDQQLDRQQPDRAALAFAPRFFFNDTATTEIYTLSLHDALPISTQRPARQDRRRRLDRNSQSAAR